MNGIKICPATVATSSKVTPQNTAFVLEEYGIEKAEAVNGGLCAVMAAGSVIININTPRKTKRTA